MPCLTLHSQKKLLISLLSTLLGALPCGSSPHALSKLIHELVPKVFNASFFHLMRSDQSMERSDFS